MEDLIIADLRKMGYAGKELEEKVLQQKEELDRAFVRLLEEVRKDDAIPLEESEVFSGGKKKPSPDHQ